MEGGKEVKENEFKRLVFSVTLISLIATVVTILGIRILLGNTFLSIGNIFILIVVMALVSFLLSFISIGLRKKISERGFGTIVLISGLIGTINGLILVSIFLQLIKFLTQKNVLRLLGERPLSDKEMFIVFLVLWAFSGFFIGTIVGLFLKRNN